MALVKNTLATELAKAWATYPTTALLAAQAWAAAYNTYAMAAQACSLLKPTVVNLAGLISGLKDAFQNGGSCADVAQAVANAHRDYWTAALFGATGTVTVIGGTATLKSGLETLWTVQAATMTSFADSAAAHATLFDTFTKTVQVVDTAVPPPTGCGPSPIT